MLSHSSSRVSNSLRCVSKEVARMTTRSTLAVASSSAFDILIWCQIQQELVAVLEQHQRHISKISASEEYNHILRPRIVIRVIQDNNDRISNFMLRSHGRHRSH